jgi:uncharacterized protein
LSQVLDSPDLTDGAVSAFGRDVRRLRPNLMIGGVEGLSERPWSGAILRLPDAEVGLVDSAAAVL